METKQLNGYTLDILDVTEFKEYYYNNKDWFSANAEKAFLKALDIPPKFYKEQPEETQKELLENREIFVRESKKFFNKVIVVVKYVYDDNDVIRTKILNACRLDRVEAIKRYDQLKDIEEIHNKFEHTSFIKDGYVSLIISDGIEKNRENQVLAVDFPVLLNKKPVIHKALYTLPTEKSLTPIEHIHYLTSNEIELGVDYNSIKEAVDDEIDFLEDHNRSECEDEPILRETEVVTLALQELKVIPKSLTEKVTAYINKAETELTIKKLESFVLDFDETVNGYKQRTNLREVSGAAVSKYLNSSAFKELVESMKEFEEDELLPV